MVRFDKPCILVSGAVEYFREHMAIGDYLSQDGAAEMTWVGSGSELLGISGRCRLEHFENLCAGRHPRTGEKLTARDKGDARRVCYFAQLSPPKDVSVLHLVGGDQRIAQWWKAAVTETLAEIEALTATRVRKAGENSDRRTGSMVAAVVTHDANRALDPQLHTHVCILNLTYDEEEVRWKSVQPSGYFRHQAYLREVCYNKLAAAMSAAGYQLESGQRIGFTISGVPPELRDIFSKRRREILRQAAQSGATTQDDLQAITARSRAEKTKATAATLRSRWLEEAGAHYEALRVAIAGANGRPAVVEPITAAEAVKSAEAHVFERFSVVDSRHLLREALIAGRGRAALDGLKRALANRERSGDLLRSDDEIASRLGLEAEAEFTGWASAQRSRRGPLGDASSLVGLEADQATAVREVLGSNAGVVIFQGDAGTGKTTCLKSVVAGIHRDGGRIFGCAPSSGATDVLRKDLTSDADTLQQLLTNEALQEQTKGRVLLVDEAGLISVNQMRDLCRLAARNDNRLLLVGDTKQHTSVEAGDALRCLQEFAQVPIFQLTEIRRQRDPAFRKAVSLLARGNAFAAFNAFDRLGAVCEMPNDDTMWQAAAADYVCTVRAGQTCLAISPVWAEIREFTTAVRAQLRTAGALTGSDHIIGTVASLKWTQEERRRLQSYRAGDVLTFHRDFGPFRKFDVWRVARTSQRELVVVNSRGMERTLDPRRVSGFDVGSAHEISLAAGDRLLLRANLKPASLRNGDIVQISSISTEGEIQLTDGRAIPAWFREFTHGYATTSHASQGKTVDRGILLMADAGIAAGNLKQAYVSNSRFRESQVIYTSDKDSARDAMMRAGDRKLAMEMATPDAARRPSWRIRWAARIAEIFPRMAA